eukprot:gb/GECG01000118.1/.p1 GENE.gb/GECG01000118.1/~~gb/GECG01000118.1/.p1  ORF type:complete len:295 (+),score=22.55 gb/GECG01000118.1/:1-885(+)
MHAQHLLDRSSTTTNRKTSGGYNNSRADNTGSEISHRSMDPVGGATAPSASFLEDSSKHSSNHPVSSSSSVAGASSSSSFIGPYARRALSVKAMDWQFAAWQMVELLLHPAKVYRLNQRRKQTKNQWARDDPAVVMLQCFFILPICCAYAFALNHFTLSRVVRLLFHGLAQYIVFGGCISAICRTLANNYLKVESTPHAVEQEVEWMYAFDVHTNSFWVMFLIGYVGQYAILPLLLSQYYYNLGMVCGNLLYTAAIAGYWYITFSGYVGKPCVFRAAMLFWRCCCRDALQYFHS